jgi:hypothetical protein
MLALQPRQHARDRRDRFRRRKQPQRVPGRRGVHHHPIAGARAGEPDDLEHADQLVDAGNRQCEQRVDVRAIEPGAVLQHVAERLPVLPQPAPEGPRRIELDRLEPSAAAGGASWNADRSGAARQANAEGVAERVRRIGGDGKDPLAAARGVDRPRSGTGRLADTALAGEELECWFSD